MDILVVGALILYGLVEVQLSGGLALGVLLRSHGSETVLKMRGSHVVMLLFSCGHSLSRTCIPGLHHPRLWH